jgi:hypothetical protein
MSRDFNIIYKDHPMARYQVKGDIYQETYDDIVLLCIRCSRGSSRIRSGMRIPLTRNSKITSGGVTQDEVGNLLDNFKTDILSTLTTQLDVL